MLGAFISILNQTLINIALPHMMTDFNISATTAQWLTTAYMLVNGVVIPITAFLIGTYGTRILFLSAMLSFTLGSLVCSLAPTFAVMLIGRVIQAVGAGMMMPLVMSVFLAVFPPEKRGSAMGTMGIAMIFAPAVGPTLAGWIVEHYTWRILFIMMIPLGLIDILLALRWLKDVLKPTHPVFDSWGAIFSTIGFGTLLYGFSEAGSHGWSSFTVISFLSVGVLFIGIFIWRELSIDQPLLEFRVFRYNIFTLTTIINAAITLSMFGGMILLPIYLQNIRGFTPLQSGLLMLPGAILMGIMSPVSGALFDRIGARPLVIVGLLITGITTWELTKLTSSTTYSSIIWIYTIRNLGMSLLMMPVQTAGLNQIPQHLNSHATAMSNTMRQIAGSIGTALLVTVMTSRSTVHQSDFSNAIAASNTYISGAFQSLSTTMAAVSGLPAEAGSALVIQTLYGLTMKESTIKGINDAFLVALLFTALALVLSLFLRRVKHPKTTEEAASPAPELPQETG
ncbi:DHA2 family efflux MFS transporter permease subunit [Paenibacillus sp. y28]|uniref:DHA2 family efflux MFS transporter permease subunit n=1 Tax=Paenibacillus sp. y28 TaxID=3129110 RepID=UPI003FA79548